MSCADNLTEFKLDIEYVVNNKMQTLAVSIDVSNAFNDVLSDLLITILAENGFSRKVLTFIKFSTHQRSVFSEINQDLPQHSYKGVPI